LVQSHCHEDGWIVSDENGKSYLEQHRVNSRAEQYNSMMITGDPEWLDTTVEVKLRPLSFTQPRGLVFRYHTNRHYYVFSLADGHRARLAVRLPLEQKLRVAEWRTLGETEFRYGVKQYYAVKVDNEGSRIRAFVDGRLILEAADSEILKGKAGVTANAPARFMDFSVKASDASADLIRDRIAARGRALSKPRASNPKPQLWKKIETPGYGAGRDVRFGDLDGDGRTDILIAQNIPRVRGDAFDHISCLTAINLDGNILWQSGRADPRNTLLTNDTPLQIHDIDGDGRNDIVLVRDFQLQILDGATGKLKQSAWMPEMARDLKDRPYELNNGDSIALLNLSGHKEPREILAKDRYQTFWIFSSDLKLLWSGTGQTGHYPYPYDIDGDGKQEFVLGYSLWSHDGRKLWSHDTDLHDHADGIVVGNFSGNPAAQPMVYACGSGEGFILFDREGAILKHTRIGHAQSPTIAKFRAGIPGLQLLTVNYWRNPGILSLFDSAGNLLKQDEPIHSGSPLLPVNWRGDGQEFAMLSSDPAEGGLIDGEFRRVVMFPDDGHPTLAYAAANLTGDPRDEIIVWDTKRIWIYTQDRPFKGTRIYAPVRNPDYNESNYRTTVSMPAWEDVR
jgi:rhamnogalacturonan endolyase